LIAELLRKGIKSLGCKSENSNKDDFTTGTFFIRGVINKKGIK
jgi:hypothetical protein